MPLQLYKIIHLTGLAMTLMSFGGLMMAALQGVDKADAAWRKPVTIMHGVGLFLVLLGGFGMLARYGIHWPWPGWVFVKFGIWIIYGGAIALIWRKRELNKPLWMGVLLLFVLAAYVASYKPF